MNQIKEIYEKKLDNEWKSDLDVGQYSVGWMYLQQYLTDENQKILDAGCGNGSYSYSLLKSGFKDVYAIDLFDKAPFEKEGFHYVQGSIEKLPFKDEFFDFIFAQSVIYYSKNCMDTIAELKRVLKPGGKVYISGHTKYSIYTFIRRVKVVFHSKTVEHLQGVKFYSTKYYKNLFKKNDMSILKVDGWGIRSIDFIFRFISVICKKIKVKYNDPRKRISKNKLWCKFKSVCGYHFVIVAQKGTKND